VEAPNKAAALKPGSTAAIKIDARAVKDALVIPAAALLKDSEGATTVMVVSDDGRAHQTPVEVGVRNGDLVQITKGLSAGQVVVTTGAYGLPDKTQVKVAPSDTAKPAAAATEKE
jgi:multidrug efflux pump subunit AcrA (membrane-fusion protein)